jgi:DNA-binding NtrC family response regulator
VRLVGLQDDLKAILRECRVPLVFLIMRKVSEQGFAAAIKIQSAQSPAPPLIAGGPEWTRSAVLRAVRYGAVDILVTPIDADEIRNKMQSLMQHAG